MTLYSDSYAQMRRHRDIMPPPPGVPVSLSTFVGVVPATNNMLASPQVFPGFNPFTQLNDAWSFQQASGVGGIVGPDGTATATHLIEDSSNNVHSMTSFLGSSHFGVTAIAIPYAEWRFAFIAQAAERTRCVLSLIARDNSTGLLGTITAGFDLAGSNTSYANSVSAGCAILGTSMKALGAGWYLCLMDCTFNGVSNPSTALFFHPAILLDNGSGTAAASTAYTGNSTSGINVWWGSLMPVGAWQMNNLAFFDDFNSLSTIDVNNTQVPGFNWYVESTWPDNSTIVNGSSFFNAETFALMPPSHLISSDITQSGSTITLLRDRTGYGEGITTAYPVHPNSYVGKVFGYPGLFEASMAWDESLYTIGGLSNLGNVAFWGSAIEMLTNNPTSPPGSTNFREDDIVEGTNGPRAAASIHDWTITNPGIITDNGFGVDIPASLVTATTFTNQNRYGHLTIPAAFNGGLYSVCLFLFNGLMMETNFWGLNIRPNNDAGKPIGAAVSGDSQHIPLMLGAGHLSSDGTYGDAAATWVPVTVDFVKAFQTTQTPLYVPAAPMLSSPTDVATGSTTASLSVSTTAGGGTIYWVVTLSAIPPTEAQIKAGLDHSGIAASASGSQIVTATGVQTISGGATGLTTMTSYTAHFAQEVYTPTQISNVVSGAGFTTS